MCLPSLVAAWLVFKQPFSIKLDYIDHNTTHKAKEIYTALGSTAAARIASYGFNVICVCMRVFLIRYNGGFNCYKAFKRTYYGPLVLAYQL